MMIDLSNEGYIDLHSTMLLLKYKKEWKGKKQYVFTFHYATT